jgi:signal transduction histidine kinase
MIGGWFASAERISETVAELREQLPRILDPLQVPPAIVDTLVGSGRIVFASVYIWDKHKRKVRLVASRGPADPPPLAALSPQAVQHEPGGPPRSLHRAPLERSGRRQGEHAEKANQLLRTLDGLRIDALVPIAIDELAVGWLGVRQEAWSDGFAHEEIEHLERGMRTAAIVLENLRGFETLKEQNRLAALGTMAAGLAHEIRNPLAGIKGAAQYLRDARDPAETAEFLQLIVDEIDRLNVVVSQFLDYARPFDIDRSPMAMNEVIERVVELVTRQGLAKNIVIETDLERPLPTLNADRNKLAQVVLNLVQNAIQAVERGGTVTISSRTGRLADASGEFRACLQVRVEDTGPGISREDLDQLFIPFFTTRSHGTGLGLPICQRIVQGHGGDIRVRTRPNEGSRFIVTLPLGTEVGAEPPPIEETDLEPKPTEEVVPGATSANSPSTVADDTGEWTA